jgi:hypothetical protein
MPTYQNHDIVGLQDRLYTLKCQLSVLERAISCPQSQDANDEELLNGMMGLVVEEQEELEDISNVLETWKTPRDPKTQSNVIRLAVDLDERPQSARVH